MMYKMVLVVVPLLAFFIFSAWFNFQNFPAPTGSFAVGATELHAIDVQREETNELGKPRELMLHVWYPTKETKDQQKSDTYSADAMANMLAFMSKQSGMPQWLFAGLRNTKTYEAKHATVGENQYPVIVLSHGAGPMVQQYSWLGEELASHGYIVVGINHTYMAAVTRFPDGRVIESLLGKKKKEGKQIADAWKAEQRSVAVADIQFVLDYLMTINEEQASPLFHKVDLARVGVCGHSFGGTVIMQVCQRDTRVKAGVCMDQGFKGNDANIPLLAPVLNLMAEKSHAWHGERGAHERQELIALSRQESSKLSLATIPGIGHAIFLDLPLLLHTTLITQLLSHCVDFDIDASSAQARKAIEQIKSEIVSFFGKRVKNADDRF